MSKVQIVAFTDSHVDGAGGVLAQRHRRHREVEALLPDDVDFTGQIDRERADGATGAVALAGATTVGYLLGSPRVEEGHVWSHLAGHAVHDPELVRDLYAVAAEAWVEAGLTRHVVFVPAMRELVEPWFRLGFGASAALAARPTGGELTGTHPADVVVRESTPADVEAVAALDRVLFETNARSPSFSDLPVPSTKALVGEWLPTWQDPVHTHFVAERDGSIVGHLLLYRRPGDDLRIPPNSIDLADAATNPGVRASGVGVALTAHALSWARDHGYETMTVDWRMTNLFASRFWPRRGFRETFLRLYRSIP